jgi:hypothetical protein
MRANVQIPSYYLHQLDKDNAELIRKFAELATLREQVRQKEAALRTKRASHERSATTLQLSVRRSFRPSPGG